MPLQLQLNRDALADFCRKHGIIRLSVFGSALRDDFGPQSDVDFLYVFHPDAKVGWDIVDIEEALAELVGRPLDFISEIGLNRWIRDEILKHRVVLFEDERFDDLLPRIHMPQAGAA